MELKTVIAAIRKRHALRDDADVRLKAMASTLAVDDGDPYRFTARITTDGIDRDNEVLLPVGCDATEFDKSGALFWNHSYDQPVGIAGKLSRGDNYIDGKASFLKRPDDWEGQWFPDFVRAFVSQMAAADKAVGVSVGFLPVEARPPTNDDRRLFGDAVRRVISRWKLLEWSIAPVQSNPQAMVQAVGKSLSHECIKALFPDYAPAAPQKQIVVVLPRFKAPVPRDTIASLAEKRVTQILLKKRGVLYV